MKKEKKAVIIEYVDLQKTWGVVFASTKQRALRGNYPTKAEAREAITRNNKNKDRIYTLTV